MDNNTLNLIKYYESNLKEIFYISQKINDLGKFVKTSLIFWEEYENPKYTIMEINSGLQKQQPYYRAQSSFTNNNGKKERITAYIGPISSFDGGKDDIKLKEITIKKLRDIMIEKSNISEYLYDNYKNEKCDNIIKDIERLKNSSITESLLFNRIKFLR